MGPLALAALLALTTATPAHGQFGKLRDRVKAKVEERVDRRTEEAAEAAVDAADPTSGQATAPAAGEDAPAASGAATGAGAAELAPNQGPWANYDFVPGERVLFADDFSADRVGNFPRRLEFVGGNMEIVEWQGGRWLRAEGGEFLINLPDTLPERFTMEFNLWGHGNGMQISFVDHSAGGDRRIDINAHSAYLYSNAIRGEGSLGVNTQETPIRVRIAVDGDYLKLYANEKRALNVPNAKLGRSNRIYVNLNGWSAEDPRMIGDLRIAAGGRELYDALSAEGRVATQGILFDTGSDRIRPESSPTLTEIGEMLRAHGDLRLTIEGHTDNVGASDANLALSERRAAAVKAHLEQAFGIAPDRLEARGLGDTKPAAPNATPEGRQQNRRVELVKR